jgi:prepilin-type N-terminal cleavage/methylation domain-containing protein
MNLEMQPANKNKNKGFSLVEVVLALAIFALSWSAIASLSLSGFSAIEQGGRFTEAESLVQEGLEGVRAASEPAWNELIFSTSSVEISGGEWQFSGEGTTEIIDLFTRTILFNDVCRDSSDNVVDCPGDYVDPHSKEVVSNILWNVRPGIDNEVEHRTILTNWDSIDWIQTDWFGGSGQSEWSDVSQYDSDNGDVFTAIAGQVSLPNGETIDPGFDLAGGPSTFNWGFDTPSEYTYDSNGIDISNGTAKLIATIPSTFRVTEYYIADGVFTGTNYNLVLDQDLESDYFVIVQGSDGNGTNNGNTGPDENYVSLISDPFATGDLTASGSTNQIGLVRNNSVSSWIGVVTVVESQADSDTSGFNLLGVERVTHSGASLTGTDTSASSWADINQTMLMGGFNGSGCNTAQTNTASHKACHVKFYPSGSNTINWERNSTGAGGFGEAYSTIMVVEWGTDWNIQRVNVTGSAGGNGADATGEYDTAAIGSVDRDNTWVWGTGWTNDGGIGDSAEGTLITLGDGVNQNTTETSVAVGQEYSDTRNFEVYALTHDDLAVDYKFKTDGDSGILTVDVSVDSATSTNNRMSIITNGQNGTGNAFPRPIMSSRYVSDDTVRIERRRTGQNFPAWVQGIDYSKIIPSTPSGAGSNPDFTTDATGWTYSDWEGNGTYVNGEHQVTGGNPDGYIEIDIDERRSTTLSGYWEQAFTTTVDNPNIATLDLDWVVNQYDGQYVNDFEVLVFVDTVSGAPTLGTEVWSSGSITGLTSWDNVPSIDLTPTVTTSGTYYVKLAARTTYGFMWFQSGQQTVGFDNVNIYWEATPTGASYSTANPTVQPTSSFTTTGLGVWSDFTEVATKDGGEIYYQLSDDDGVTWQYYNGSNWVTAGPGNYNIATDVDTNISSFSSANQKIMFKAFLESDGMQAVQLNDVSVTFSPVGSSWEFSAWNAGFLETVSGSSYSSDGNPDSFVDVSLASSFVGLNAGGVWKQEFTNYGTNPAPVTFDFDYRVSEFPGSPTSATIQIYVDSSNGVPITAVGSPVNLSGTTAWVSAPQVDLSSVVTSSGTYYVKIVFNINAGAGGPYVVDFDNAVLDLGTGAYPSTGTLTSSAFDMSDDSPIQIIEWDETLPSVNESIQFQVRTAPDSGGSPGAWTSWYGDPSVGDWFTDSSGSLISTDLNDNQWMQYRVELNGNGSDAPILEEVRINYK